MSELDKFKRRLIRSVARLLLQEKKQPDEVWEEMKKETGCDCKVLWERMRALTIKKLSRLLAAEDRTETIPAIARLTLTDWLLYDLVLVHEKIDVIGTQKFLINQDPPSLITLFSLVQRFDIESLEGDQLADAWAAATIYYNSQGRQCSPLLLQRRWYQLKEFTRDRFYEFWYIYRGNNRYLDKAMEACKLTNLQKAIAKRYPKVVIQTFPEWEQLIENKLVILPEVFEQKMSNENLPEPSDADAPDIVVVEPVIETIDLEADSDSEEIKENNEDLHKMGSREKSHETQINSSEKYIADIETQLTNTEIDLGVTVKTEPTEDDIESDGLCNVKIVETTHMPKEVTSGVSIHNNKIAVSDQPPVEEPYISADCFNGHPDIACDVIPEENTSSYAIDEDLIKQKAEEYLQKTKTKSRITAEHIQIKSEITEDEVDLEPVNDCTDDINKKKIVEIPWEPEDFKSKLKDNNKPKKDDISTPNSNLQIETNIPEMIDVIIKEKAEQLFEKSDKLKKANLETETKVIYTLDEMSSDFNFCDDGIEFVDDGIKLVDDGEEFRQENNVSETPSESLVKMEGSDNANDETPKFDLKLLMNPVVYTTKIDIMDILKNKNFETVKTKELINKIIIESKPYSKKSVRVNEIKENHGFEQTFSCNYNKDNHDLVEMDSTDDENECNIITEDQRVKPSSYLLRKPRCLSYNPIQLCKNPDFNTRLKRLTVGFFSSTRNRQLLRACKPITIDVTKAFESKLVNGSLYLKSSSIATENASGKDEEIKEINTNQTAMVMPSAMPMQCLINNTEKMNIDDLVRNQVNATKSFSVPIEEEYLSLERKKVISLPDLASVRRINQRLLTAEVTPIRFQNDTDINQSSVAEQHEVLVNEHPKTNLENANTNQLINLNVESSKANVENKNSLKKDKTTKESSVTKLHKRITFPPPSPATQPSWAKKYFYLKDQLLTTDSLERMLNVFNGVIPGSKYSKKKKINNRELITETQNKQNKIKPVEETSLGQVKESLEQSSQTETDERIQGNEPPPKKPKLKVNSKPTVQTGRRRRYCCWANRKIARLNNQKVQYMQHLCDPQMCVCCCRAELAKLIKKKQCCCGKYSSKSTDNLQESIVLSDDEEDKVKLQNACESIETVVQQSSECNVSAYRIPNPVCSSMEQSPLPTQTMQDHIQRTIDRTFVNNPINIDIEGFKLSNVACETEKSCLTDTILTNIPDKKQENTDSVTNDLTAPAVNPENINLTKINHITVKPLSKLNSNLNDIKDSQTLLAPKKIITKIISPNKYIAKTNDPFAGQSARPLPDKSVIYSHCPPKITTNTPKREIIIDGSNASPLVKTSVEKESRDRVLCLDNKRDSVYRKDSPIFLGKNKILLTNVNLTKRSDNCYSQSVIPKVIPTVPLPSGVNLILLPSGELMYNVDSGIELSAEQISSLPAIMAAVQLQLKNTLGIDYKPQHAEIVSNSSNEKSQYLAEGIHNIEGDPIESTNEVPFDGKVKVDNDNVQSDQNIQSKTTIISEKVNICNKEIEKLNAAEELLSNNLNNKTLNADLQECTDNSESVKTSVESTTTTLDITNEAFSHETEITPNKTIDPESNNENLTTTKKTILSDLMHMSGISTDDVIPIMQVNSMSVQAPSIAGELSLPSQNTDENVSDTPLNNSSKESAVSISNTLPELFPVTCFDELKYVCENNGQFFKLDFDTGVIVPINVCIKKNSKSRKVNILQKSVIDLTEETDIPQNNNVKHKNLQTYSVYQGKKLSILPKAHINADNVKPLKLFKAIHHSTDMSSIQNKQIVISSIETSGNIGKRRLNRRKQCLNSRIEAKIDLVDSDAPMEEEYLVDSNSDTENERNYRFTSQINKRLNVKEVSDDDSSDDESLAKISKRLKEIKDNSEGSNSKIDKFTEDIANVSPNEEVLIETDDISKALVSEVSSDISIQNIEFVQGEEDMPTALEFLDETLENETTQEEDCILGF